MGNRGIAVDTSAIEHLARHETTLTDDALRTAVAETATWAGRDPHYSRRVGRPLTTDEMLAALWRLLHPQAGKLGLIGYDDVWLTKVTKLLLEAATGPKGHNYTEPRQIHRGYDFELELLDSRGKQTGHIVKVTVELDRRVGD